jgi:hypothetical protein
MSDNVKSSRLPLENRQRARILKAVPSAATEKTCASENLGRRPHGHVNREEAICRTSYAIRVRLVGSWR